MKMLRFEVRGQYITRIDEEVPVAKCMNVFKAHFDFLTEEWTGTKTAIFVQGNYSKSQVLDEKGECIVPWEFFDTEEKTRGYVSVYCGDLMTANESKVMIAKTGYRESDASVPPTPDVYHQILENMDGKLDKAGYVPNKYLGTDNEGNVVEKEGPSGGGSGTTDYNSLENKPHINGVELQGEKTLEELGIQKKGNYASKEEIPTSLPASDVYEWAKEPEKPSYTSEEVGAEEKGTIDKHNVSKETHQDIREVLTRLEEKVKAIANSDDESLDTLAEIVAYIKSNKSLIDAITTGKVSTSDIVNDLVTNVETKVLSAAQGVELKRQIDEVVKSIPKKLPNPHKLTITGAVKAEYDGSGAVTVEIPDSSEEINAKLDKNQGAENKGKALVVGEDGNVTVGEATGGDGIPIINTMSGESPLVVPDSAERVNKGFSLIGKSEQVTTNGTQLFDANKMNGLTKSGVTVSVKDGMITVTGMATKDEWIQAYISVEEYKKIFKPGEKIFIKSYKTTDCNYDFGLYGAHGSPILGTVTEGNSQPNGTLLPTIYPARDTDFYFFVSVKQGVTLKGSLQPMVYQMGNGTYEPYTGGKPSPSPDNPQDIKNVGKWNPETQKYEVGVRVTGNNILNTQIEPDTKGIYQGWKVGDGKKKITLSIIDKGNNKDISNCYFGLSGNGTDQKDGVAWLIESGKITKTKMTSLNPYVTIFPSDETAQRKILERFDIQCEFGEIQTEYQPYKEQTITLTSDRPITKWDKLVEQDGQIGWLYASKKYVITGNEIFEHRSGYDQDAYTNRFIVINDLFVNRLNDKQIAYCKILKRVQYIYAQNKLEEGIDTNVNQLHIKLSNDRIGVLSSDDTETRTTKITEYIKNTYTDGIEIMYMSNNSVFVPLPQSEQDAIRALKTYYPTTVVSVDGGEVYGGVEVTYTADTKNYIDNKIKQEKSTPTAIPEIS